MRWSFELTCATPDAVAKVNFARGSGEIPLHVAYRRGRGGLALNRMAGGEWGAETVVPTGLPEDPETLSIALDLTDTGRVVLHHDGGTKALAWLDAAMLGEARIWTEGSAIRIAEEGEDAPDLRLWRFARGPSGIAAPVAGLSADRPPGLTVLVRAEGTAPVADNLRMLGGLADEIVLVDAGTGDGAFRRASAQKTRLFELRTHLYPATPPAPGSANTRAALAGGRNTRAHFANWGLARTGRAVVMDWPADRIALREPLAEMIARFSLRSRGDGFVLWTCGVSLFTDGTRFWVDTLSAPSGFAVLPAAHGAAWVNLPAHEAPDEAMLYRLPVMFHRKAVFAEVVPLDAPRAGEPLTMHEKRLRAVQVALAGGDQPEGLVEVTGPADPALALQELPQATLDLSRALEARYRARPRLTDRADGTVHPAGKVAQQDMAVLVFSEPGREDHQAAIRASWGGMLRDLGIPCLFVIGRPDLPSRIASDVLHVAVPPGREFLGARVAAALEYSLGRMNVDRVLKLDDDCLLDPLALLRADLGEAEFVCGARDDPALADEALALCVNPQLRDIPLLAEPGDWPDGRCGYVLGRRARLILMSNRDALRTALREDAAIAAALKGRGIDPAWGLGSRSAIRHADGWDGRAGAALIAAIPDAATLAEGWEALGWADAARMTAIEFETAWLVGWDWQQARDRET